MYNLKVVIIGGGIAGLTAAIALKLKNHRVIVKEKRSFATNPGLAFMIPSNSVRELESLTGTVLDMDEHHIKQFILLNSEGEVQQELALSDWYAVKRITLVNYLLRHLGPKEYAENSVFSHFIYEDKKAIGAVFMDGSIEYGDLFIGADGINSKVREFVCNPEYFPNEINELVCIVKHLDHKINDLTFRKFESLKKGLSFGFIPISDDEHVWYLQFDHALYANLLLDKTGSKPQIRNELLQEFPLEVRNLILKSNLKEVHLWINKELRLLDKHFKNNVCLIGDAAHGSISLTSSGVHSGITSAIDLVYNLSHVENIENALLNFESSRKKQHLVTIESAHKLKLQFHQLSKKSENYFLPLIK
jgi:2-polyprenyl-6-methoxyphenol hydroxylase-like FAD-dependent oxidoreductase